MNWSLYNTTWSWAPKVDKRSWEVKGKSNYRVWYLDVRWGSLCLHVNNERD